MNTVKETLDYLLKRIGIGEYLLNPFVFGKGQWKDIRKLREEHDAA